ncbi:glycosyltransferase family 1 protein [Cellulomonas fimi]|uniref:glycosyltransferase family 4 protein n=1 Tax=Cellulomonas fimi TaxID=1708 RepID=UPI001B85C8D0|nr:glycosyltransferase family 1 protein [Cellulomonas fimi]
MRITLDATPLLGPRTGVGRYVQHLVDELPAAIARRGLDAEVRATTWTARGARLTGLPAGITQAGPRVPARLLRELWRRTSLPPIEALVGRTDVFHGTNFTSPPTRRAREVVTVHDLTYVEHAGTVSRASLLYRELVPRALDRGALVVTPSETVATAVRAHYALPADRVRATPLGVDRGWFDATPPDPAWLDVRGLPREYVVFVGSLDPRKNLPTLLAAHARALAADAGVPALVLAGPAGREHSLTAQDGVHVTGWLEDDELRSLVAGSRALALPSLDEGFGLPVLEALACGRPVVVSDIPALREVAGPLAHAAPPSDPDALAGALLAALSAPDDDAARALRRDRAREFTWSRFADRTLDAYLAA